MTTEEMTEKQKLIKNYLNSRLNQLVSGKNPLCVFHKPLSIAEMLDKNSIALEDHVRPTECTRFKSITEWTKYESIDEIEAIIQKNTSRERHEYVIGFTDQYPETPIKYDYELQRIEYVLEYVVFKARGPRKNENIAGVYTRGYRDGFKEGFLRALWRHFDDFSKGIPDARPKPKEFVFIENQEEKTMELKTNAYIQGHREGFREGYLQAAPDGWRFANLNYSWNK